MAEQMLPVLNDLSAPFQAGLEEGRLVLPHCRATGAAFWPPSPVSPFVTGGQVEWRDADPEGVVTGLVVYRRAFQKILESRLPYGIALVELVSGVRLQAHVAEPDKLAPGDRAKVHFAPLVDNSQPVLHARRLDG